MDLGPYAHFIITAYAIAFAVVVGLILWIRFDRKRLEAALEDLEAQGISRRSTGSSAK